MKIIWKFQYLNSKKYFSVDEDLSSGSSSDSDSDSEDYPTTSLDSNIGFNNLFTYQLSQPLGNWEKHTRVKSFDEIEPSSPNNFLFFSDNF